MQTSASTEVGTYAGCIPADSSMPLASSSHFYRRFTRKSIVDLPEYEILNSRDDIEMTRAVALASQYEYDDSYDDLGMSLVKSAYEETEDLSGRRGLDSGPEPPLKWGSGMKRNHKFMLRMVKTTATKFLDLLQCQTQRSRCSSRSLERFDTRSGSWGDIPIGASKMMKYAGHTDTEGPKTHHSGNHSDKRRGCGRVPVSRADSNEKVQDHEEEDIDARHSFSSTMVKGRGRGFSSEVRADFEPKEGDGEVAGRRDSSHACVREQGDGELLVEEILHTPLGGDGEERVTR